MVIALDVMGGDVPIHSSVEAAVKAANDFNQEILLILIRNPPDFNQRRPPDFNQAPPHFSQEINQVDTQVDSLILIRRST